MHHLLSSVSEGTKRLTVNSWPAPSGVGPPSPRKAVVPKRERVDRQSPVQPPSWRRTRMLFLTLTPHNLSSCPNTVPGIKKKKKKDNNGHDQLYEAVQKAIRRRKRNASPRYLRDGSAHAHRKLRKTTLCSARVPKTLRSCFH